MRANPGGRLAEDVLLGAQQFGGQPGPEPPRNAGPSLLWGLNAMKIDGHYDEAADIAWLRFEAFDPETVVSEEVEFGLRELVDRRVVGLEFWKVSQRLPKELLSLFPHPPVGVAR